MLLYSASGDGSSISTMTSSEYWQLLKDIHVADKGFGDKNSARFDLIFHKSNQKVGLQDERENNPDKCVTCAEAQLLWLH